MLRYFKLFAHTDLWNTLLCFLPLIRLFNSYVFFRDLLKGFLYELPNTQSFHIICSYTSYFLLKLLIKLTIKHLYDGAINDYLPAVCFKAS